MDVSPCVFDFNAIKRTERAYLDSLNTHPDNLELRMRLAWCLFMEALYQSGQETALKQLAAQETNGEAAEGFADQMLRDRDAQTLLRDCLHHTFTVIQLSSQSADRQEGEKIQALATLSGAHESVAQARARASNMLAEVVREVMHIPASEEA